MKSTSDRTRVLVLEQRLAQMRALVAAAYREGWRRGYYQGGDQDCRMFEPDVDTDWEDSTVRARLLRLARDT